MLYNTGMPNGLPTPFNFSQSSLQDYADCPRRFELRYLQQLHWPAEETAPALENETRQQEGQLFHRLAQQALIGLPLEKLASLAAGEHLSRWWLNFSQAFFPLTEKNLSGARLLAETTLSMPLGAHRLLAKYDLIAIHKDRVTIYDWKTSHKRPKNEWMKARLQTRVYPFLLASASAALNGGQPFAPEQIEMVYWYTDFPGEPAIFAYTQEQFKRDQSALERLAGEISALQEFPLTDETRQCAFCAYRSYCGRGRSAGNWQEAEASDETQAAIELNYEQINEIEF